MIVDSHCHAGRGDDVSGPRGSDAPLATYMRRARAAGIGKSVLVGTFVTDYMEANKYVARTAARYPDRFIPFVLVHSRRDKGQVERMVSYFMYQHGFRGIKVHKHDAPIGKEVCEVAQALHLPVIYDIMGKNSLIESIVPAYPDVRFIIPHLGSFADDWRAQERLVRQLAYYPNLYTDTAGVRRFDYIVQALEQVGPDHVLFGTDGPWLHPGLELYKIRLLGLDPHDEALVCGGNILRLTSSVGKEQTGISSVRPSYRPISGSHSGRGRIM